VHARALQIYSTPTDGVSTN